MALWRRVDEESNNDKGRPAEGNSFKDDIGELDEDHLFDVDRNQERQQRDEEYNLDDQGTDTATAESISGTSGVGSFPVDINRRGVDEPALSGSVPISIPSKKLGKMSSSTEDSFLPPHELAEGRGKVPVQDEEQEELESSIKKNRALGLRTQVLRDTGFIEEEGSRNANHGGGSQLPQSLPPGWSRGAFPPR